MMKVALQMLNKYFGYSKFRKGQEEIIQSILSGNDTVGIMPTGGGKSICYQIPALCFDGITIVISPLISLMKDQVDALNVAGINATFINSTLSSTEYSARMNGIQNGTYKIIYVAPERLDGDGFTNIITRHTVSQIAIDEAHCISHWGHDFRKSYTRIKDFIGCFSTKPIITAFTATATEEVRVDIINQLGIKNPKLTITGFDRDNLKYMIVRGARKNNFIKDYIENNKDVSGIIYCATRKETDKVYESILKSGYDVSKYHAGMSENERAKNQEDFIYDRTNIMVATNAFGMGIDKSNIRYVIHHNMPKNLEAYYQEMGRAGRDGEPSECILLFSGQDIMLNKYFIEEVGEATEDVKERKYEQLQKIVDYSYTTGCLRKYILEYFGENYDKDSCENCSNCTDELDKEDITVEAQKIISCVYRMNQRFGTNTVAKVLKGSKADGMDGFTNLSTYGIMKELQISRIKEYINVLIADGYLRMEGNEYPVVKITVDSSKVLKDEEKVYIQKLKHKEQAEDTGLFEILRQLRRKIAEEEGVPPFVVFSDATLKQIAVQYPNTKERMLQISGVGQVKYDKYGERVITEVGNYVIENNIDTTKIKRDITEQKEKTERAEKGNSHRLTAELYIKLGSLDAVAKERNLSPLTLQGHILDAYKEGLDISLDDFIPQGQEEKILEVIHKIGTEKLKPIKDALPEEVEYMAIKAVLAKHGM